MLLLVACTAHPLPVGEDGESGDRGDSGERGDSSSGSTTTPPPVLLGLDPALGDPLGGVTVRLSGSDLDGGSVQIGGEACTPVDGGCIAPALDAGHWDVTVRTAGGSTTLPAAWEAWSPTQIPGARVYSAAAGVGLAEAPGPIWRWEQQGDAGAWHPRDGAGLVWLADRLWMFGGWYGYTVPEWHDQITTNEIWSSPDLGASWTLELPDDPDATDRWGPRHTVGWLPFTHEGVDYAYVIGGDAFQVSSDVWRSTDGLSWELVAAESPWHGRVLQMVGSYAGDLYVMGGQVDLYDPDTALQDVWRSTDGGASWEQLEDAPWAPRGMTYNPVEYDGKLWLCGGGTYDDAPRSFYNDVWSFDGEDWTEVSPDGAAPWVGREYHNQFAAEGHLWVSSGYAADQANHNDFWYSTDGVDWTEAEDVPFQPGHADGIAVTPHGVVHASGNAMDSYSFLLIADEGAPVASWADLGEAGADLRQPDPDARPVFLTGGLGGAGALALDGVDAFLQLAAWEAQPDGRSVFWVGATGREAAWSDSVNPAMTVVGDSHGACRAQAGYSEDQIEYVVTDALGSWSEGHVLRGEGQADGVTRLLGFTHDLDGAVTAYIDGQPVGEVALTSYDRDYTGWDLVGAGYATGSRAQVDLGLVVVLPGLIGAEDLAKLTQFSRKWGVEP